MWRWGWRGREERGRYEMETEESEEEGSEEAGEDSEEDGSEDEGNGDEEVDDEEEGGDHEMVGDEKESEFKEEEAADSMETELVSEEHTEVLDSGDDCGEKEVSQPEREKHEILEVDEEASDDERTSRRKTRMSKKVEKILTDKRNPFKGGEDSWWRRFLLTKVEKILADKGKKREISEDEEKDMEEAPLIRKPRSARVAIDEKTPTKAAK